MILLCLMLLSSFGVPPARAEEGKIRLWVKIHRIRIVDLIEQPMVPEFVEWHYYLTVTEAGKIHTMDVAHEFCFDDVFLDEVHCFEVLSRLVRVQIGLIDDDTITFGDLADVSGYPGGGKDDSTEFTRGAVFNCVYDIKQNILMDNDAVEMESGYYKTSGSFDGSIGVDENDAELLFTIWDDYDPPVANPGPGRLCYTGRRVVFDGSGSTASNASSIVSYEWDLNGDGKYDSYGSQATCTYWKEGMYTVSLRVADSMGEMVVGSCNVTVETSPPIVSFVHSPMEPTIRDTIAFNDTSYDPDGSIVVWIWDFGDGESSSERNPTHAYSEKGVQWVSLTVEDDSGRTNTTGAPVIVVNLPPVAGFTFTPKEPRKGESISFRSESRDPEGEPLQHLWDFGDGSTFTEEYTAHSYKAPGSYTVSLTVTDDEGETDTVEAIVKVIQQHDLTLMVRDPLGFPVSNAVVELFSGGTRIASGATGETGMLFMSGLPEGLYEVRVSSMGLSTSTFCPLTASLTERLQVLLSIYTLGVAGGLAAAVSIVVFALKRRK